MDASLNRKSLALGVPGIILQFVGQAIVATARKYVKDRAASVPDSFDKWRVVAKPCGGLAPWCRASQWTHEDSN